MHNVYFILGMSCSGKTTIAKYLAEKYDLLYFSSDQNRMKYFKIADKKNHPFMTKNLSNFFSLPLSDLIDWEQGVCREQTPMIINDLADLSKESKSVIFEGMLDYDLIKDIIPLKNVIYLTVDKDIQKLEFFNRDTHKHMLENIYMQDISLEEKQRRANLRLEAAISSFILNNKDLAVLHRTSKTSLKDMISKVETHFNLIK